MQQKWIHYLWENEFLKIQLLGSEALHFLLPNRNANRRRFSVPLSWGMDVAEFMAGSAGTACVHCACSPHWCSSKGIGQSRAIALSSEASSAQDESPANSEVWLFSDVWGCFAEFRECYFWLDRDNRRKLPPRNICSFLISVVISHKGVIDHGNLI